MGLLDIIRNGVATANSVTADLQANVVHRKWLSQSVSGAAVYDATTRPALVTMQQKLVKNTSGAMVMSTASVVFLDPGVVVDVRDKIRLPADPTDYDGRSILNTKGFVDRVTGQPILTEVFLG